MKQFSKTQKIIVNTTFGEVDAMTEFRHQGKRYLKVYGTTSSCRDSGHPRTFNYCEPMELLVRGPHFKIPAF